VARSINIHCTLVEVPVMSEASTTAAPYGFRDLVPWADPYIVELVRKLQRSSGELLAPAGFDVRDEVPPPLLEPDTDTWLPPRERGADRIGRYRSRG
jgi:hypothetical protein